MRGVHVDDNQLLCRKVNQGAEDCFLDFPTQRQGMHACPSGTYMRGIHAGNNVLTCCYDRTRGYSELFGEFVDGGHQEQNMHACPLRAADTYMTGIHVGQNRLLCAKVVSPPSPNPDPVNINLDPERSRSFLRLNPVNSEMWRRAVRNWLWRILNLPTSGPPSVPYSSDPPEIVEGGVKRIKIHYISAEGDGHHGSAYLLFPRDYQPSGSYPAAIVLHGHASGKDVTARDWGSDHRAAALYLAQQGVIVIAPDTPSFGEAPVSEEFNPLLPACLFGGAGSKACHNEVAWRLGRLPQTYFLDDLTDVGILVAQPGVDRSRVFSVGLSLGSYQSTFLGALDTRVTGGSMAGDLFLGFACLNNPDPNPLPYPKNHECQTIPGLVNVPIGNNVEMAVATNSAPARLLEMEDLAALIAPRRFMITWGTSDPFWNGQNECAIGALKNAQTIYQLLGPDALTINFITGMPHELDDASAFELIFSRPAPIDRDYGTQCNDMHCCRPGEALIGAHVDHNQFLCAPILKTPSDEVCTVDTGTQRSGMHACPVGQYMKGLHDGRNQLTCCYDKSRGEPPLANEKVDTGTQLEDMHGCFAAGEMPRIMTGIHGDHNQLLCADAPPSVIPRPAPTVTSVTPNSTPFGAAVTVTIAGTNFINVQSVSPADNFHVNSATSITAHIPSNLSTGSWNIYVTTDAGTSGAPNTVPFFVGPTITGINPTSGPFTGGTAVWVKGAGFQDMGTHFVVGGKGVTSVNGDPWSPCYNGNECYIDTPPDDPGHNVDVVACLHGACSATTPADQFTYTGPTALGISPSSGPVTGGTCVQIGSDPPSLPSNIQVFFGEVQALHFGCAGLGFSALSPPHGAGPAPVTLKVPAFSGPPSPKSVFTYEPHAALTTIGYNRGEIGGSPGWVYLNGFAPAGGALVALTSSDPAALVPPATVTVPEGSTYGGFPLSFPPTPKTENVTLTASYEGSSVSTTIGVQGWPPVTLDLGTTVLYSGDTATAKVTLNKPAPAGGANVALSSSDPSAVTVPASVTVPAGSFTGSFPATNNYSGPNKNVTVTASYAGSSAADGMTVATCAPRKCPTGSTWNPDDCQCEPVCKPRKCPKGSYWNADDCQCEVAQ